MLNRLGVFALDITAPTDCVGFVVRSRGHSWDWGIYSAAVGRVCQCFCLLFSGRGACCFAFRW